MSILVLFLYKMVFVRGFMDTKTCLSLNVKILIWTVSSSVICIVFTAVYAYSPIIGRMGINASQNNASDKDG